jgi:hypothetical protein
MSTDVQIYRWRRAWLACIAASTICLALVTVLGLGLGHTRAALNVMWVGVVVVWCSIYARHKAGMRISWWPLRKRRRSGSS